MSALKEIVDRYDKVVGTYVQLLDDDVDLISRARAELERGVDVNSEEIASRVVHAILEEGEIEQVTFATERAIRLAIEAGVRVVDDGKEST